MVKCCTEDEEVIPLSLCKENLQFPPSKKIELISPLFDPWAGFVTCCDEFEASRNDYRFYAFYLQACPHGMFPKKSK